MTLRCRCAASCRFPMGVFRQEVGYQSARIGLRRFASTKLASAKTGVKIGSVKATVRGKSGHKPPGSKISAAAQEGERLKQEIKLSIGRPVLRPRPRPRVPGDSGDDSRPKANSNVLRHRKIPIIFGSITLLALSGSLSYLFVLSNTPAPPPSSDAVLPLPQNSDTCAYNGLAATFDSTVERTERLMGLLKRRRELAARATGHVLEVSVGTGRNLEFYDWDAVLSPPDPTTTTTTTTPNAGQMTSYTAVDISPQMLDVAQTKLTKLMAERHPDRPKTADANIRFLLQDATHPLPPPPSTQKYDTIIQTMGLCSTPDPVAQLQNLARHLTPHTGRILLLEHGRSGYPSSPSSSYSSSSPPARESTPSRLLNNLLDRSAPTHAARYGCAWNRDLAAILRASGLDLVHVRTWHLGTTWWIELRVAPAG